MPPPIAYKTREAYVKHWGEARCVQLEEERPDNCPWLHEKEVRESEAAHAALMAKIKARDEQEAELTGVTSYHTGCTLPSDPAERKAVPIVTGVLDYFPLALAEIARVSKAGNDQHNPGQPLHWSKDKSNDHAACVGRHLLERGTIDTDGQRHSAKLAWRALALLQTELETKE